MAWVAKKRGKWGVGWRDLAGKECWRSCPDQKTAKELQREVEQATALGRDWEPQEVRTVPRLREIAKDWLRACQRRKLDADTVVHYGAYLEDFACWYEEKHGIGLDKLSRKTVEAYFDQLTTTGRYGRPRATSTALKYMSALHSFWEWSARREEYRDFMPPYDPVELPRSPVGRVVVAPTWEEMDAVLSACSGWRRNLVVILRCMGLRVQQAMALKWEHVDLERKEILIVPDSGKSHQEKSGRLVPLAPVLVAELKQGAVASWDRAGEWVIPSVQKDRLARAPHMAEFWEKAVTRRVVWEGRPHHAFRRGFVSNLRGAGADRDAVEYLVGHAMEGVDDAYVDPMMALKLKEAVKKVPKLVL